MSEHLVSPLALPARAKVPAADADSASRSPLPLVGLKSGPAKVPMTYTICRLDASGRVCDQTIMTALGWKPGNLLTITASSGAIIVRLDPRGVFSVPATYQLVIPAPLRTRYRLTSGDRVLLVAARAHARLLIYTMALLHQTLAERHVLLLGGDAR